MNKYKFYISRQCMSEWLLCNTNSAISWREQVNFQWDDDEVPLVSFLLSNVCILSISYMHFAFESYINLKDCHWHLHIVIRVLKNIYAPAFTCKCHTLYNILKFPFNYNYFILDLSKTNYVHVVIWCRNMSCSHNKPSFIPGKLYI